MIHPEHGPLRAYASCDAGVPAAIWQADGGPGGARSFNAITRGRRHQHQRLYLAFAAGPPLNPELYPGLEAGADGGVATPGQGVARDGEGATS